MFTMNIIAMAAAQVAKAGGDSYWSSVVALLHFNGPNASTTFTDEKGKSYTPAGGAALSTAKSKFGGASGLFGGGKVVTAGSSTDFDLGDTYTIEAWIYPTSVGVQYGVLHRGFYTTGSNSWEGMAFSIRGLGATLRCYFYATANANEQYIDAPGLVANQWQHIVMQRSGINGVVFIGGVSKGTISGLNTPAASAKPLKIGVWDFSADAFYFPGYIDEVRITKGIARYTSGFTPPVAAFPTS